VRNIIGKAPFVFLLLPVIAAIFINELMPKSLSVIPFSAIAFVLISLSFFIPATHAYRLRWLFGLGILFLTFSIAIVSYNHERQRSAFDFPTSDTVYEGYVTDIPLEKPKSVQCNIALNAPNEKKVIIYFQKNDKSSSLAPGDVVIFKAQMQPFKNLGNPDDFDYVRFMRIKGFAASAYVPDSKWMKTGISNRTLYVISQQIRLKALDFYKSFGLDNDGYAFVTALTLGYTEFLPQEMEEAFRASGTSHVLSVSGLHVGIIYIVITSLLFFLKGSKQKNILKQIIIILFLWAYAFLTGLSVAVIRAAVMLTIFCVGNMFDRKGFSYNTVAIAAFFILLFHPFGLFEIGFQMSFMAVIAILFFQPKINRIYMPQNKFLGTLWSLFTLSLAAQAGVFPLVLYYFGTFPTYFFITNLLIVPLTNLIVYAVVPVAIFSGTRNIGFAFFDFLTMLCKWLFDKICRFTLSIVYFFETLPAAQIKGQYLTFAGMILVFILVISFFVWLEKRKFVPLFMFLSAILSLCILQIIESGQSKPVQLVVYNHPAASEIGYLRGHEKTIFSNSGNTIIPHSSKRIVKISHNIFRYKGSSKPFSIDYLILSEDNSLSMNVLKNHFSTRFVILDSSLSRSTCNRLTRQCQKLGIGVHDVARSGAFVIKF
jgi:competence protein ComEC